ncbi:hypothetical protein D3C76_1767720 [compost metagenome]
MYRVRNRQFKHEIGACVQRHLGARPFTYDGGFATLEKRAAHDCNNGVCAASPPSFLQMINMPIVQGVIFSNDAYGFHD